VKSLTSAENSVAFHYFNQAILHFTYTSIYRRRVEEEACRSSFTNL